MSRCMPLTPVGTASTTSMAKPASSLSGALLETMRIAATSQGCTMRATRRTEAPDEHPLIDVRFERRSPISSRIRLVPFDSRSRSVQRKPLSTRPLAPDAKRALEAAVGAGYSVVWFEGLRARLAAGAGWPRAARRSASRRRRPTPCIATSSSGTRATAIDRVPDQALGADATDPAHDALGAGELGTRTLHEPLAWRHLCAASAARFHPRAAVRRALRDRR